jgi:hypothetical protein
MRRRNIKTVVTRLPKKEGPPKCRRKLRRPLRGSRGFFSFFFFGFLGGALAMKGTILCT